MNNKPSPISLDTDDQIGRSPHKGPGRFVFFYKLNYFLISCCSKATAKALDRFCITRFTSRVGVAAFQINQEGGVSAMSQALIFPSHPVISDWRLATANIYFHLPDHPLILQTYVWQEFDLHPNFPALRKFLRFWDRNLEGKLHSVKIASVPLTTESPGGRIRAAGTVFTLH